MWCFKFNKYKLISPLNVTLSFGDILSDQAFESIRDDYDFTTLWNKECIKWRISKPVNQGRGKNIQYFSSQNKH